MFWSSKDMALFSNDQNLCIRVRVYFLKRHQKVKNMVVFSPFYCILTLLFQVEMHTEILDLSHTK